jgi:cytochrome c biogenesis protein
MTQTSGPQTSGPQTESRDTARTRDFARTAPPLPPLQFARWCWRQLTSMRTALLLLLMLALAAIPGSFIPQTKVDPAAVVRFGRAHETLTPTFDRLGLFSVYSSAWFSAIYILLMVSLVGCIVPRTFVYLRALRARPPKAPSRFDRLPASASYETDDDADEVLDRAATLLRGKRWRVDVDAPAGNENGADGVGVVRAEKGFLREAGNLTFHIAAVAVLVAVAIGSLWGYKGSVIVVEGEGFSNTLTQYDDFSAGGLFDASELAPFSLQLDRFDARFEIDGPQQGQPREFEAHGSYVAEPGAESEPFDIQVNHPLDVGGSSVFLVGQGYAPVVTIRDGEGEVVFSGPVPFLPEDASYTSSGVIKVPQAAPEELGFEGFFLPTAVDVNGVPRSAHPAAANPALALFVYAGDLGLGDGLPQSIFALDKDGLTQVRGPDDKPVRLLLQPGQTAAIPGGLGTISFDGVRQFARFQIGHSPAKSIALGAAVLGIAGLMASLFIRPRRAWVRTRRRDGRTLVEVARLDRVSGADLGADVEALVRDLRADGATSGRRAEA